MSTRTRLLQIADLVETIEPKHFNMTLFANSCHTVGCAIGHAMIKGLLPELRFYKDRWDNLDIETLDSNHRNFDAIDHVLGLQEGQSDIFTPEYYEDNDLTERDEGYKLPPTPQIVAQEIRKLASQL